MYRNCAMTKSDVNICAAFMMLGLMQRTKWGLSKECAHGWVTSDDSRTQQIILARSHALHQELERVFELRTHSERSLVGLVDLFSRLRWTNKNHLATKLADKGDLGLFGSAARLGFVFSAACNDKLSRD